MSTAASPPPSQRVRGLSFRKEYSQGGPSIFQTLRTRVSGRPRQPSMVKDAGEMLVPPKAPALAGRITVVLDLDETLIYAREGPLYARPGLHELLVLLKEQFEGLVWTAGIKAYAQAVVRNIDKVGAIHHCVYRHKKWFSGRAGYNKDLTLLGRDMTTTLIIENTPDCLRGNETNGILVADYEGGELEDNSLLCIALLLEDLNERRTREGISVPEYIQSSRFLTKQRVPTDLGDVMCCFCLDVNDPALFQQQKGTRVNRDLSRGQQK